AIGNKKKQRSKHDSKDDTNVILPSSSAKSTDSMPSSSKSDAHKETPSNPVIVDKGKAPMSPTPSPPQSQFIKKNRIETKPKPKLEPKHKEPCYGFTQILPADEENPFAEYPMVEEIQTTAPPV
ncbi:hypothetical protein, partial [Escherichia coli]|uniref:hypothetical protein n=1 Tax=Escherichia coli TaxID=562 RepID=UPI002578889B